MPRKRKCESWLHSLMEYVEETESPRDFWTWSGIFTLAAAMQRKIWLPFGMENLYPNLYVMLVAPPGVCRKGAAISLAKRLLMEVRVPVAADSSSKRALTKELAASGEVGMFEWEGKPRQQCALAVISKELSSLLAVDPKGMIEVLTDLYDSHDTWEYKTSDKGKDQIYGTCINCFLATTPGWLSENLPEVAIGGGFASRLAIISSATKYKRVTIPPPPSNELYKALIHDLNIIAHLKGPFRWTKEGYQRFDQWYQNLDTEIGKITDSRLLSFMERIHIMVLKTAMCLRVSYSNDLILPRPDVDGAINMLKEVVKGAGEALGGQGKAIDSGDVYRILQHIKLRKKVTLQRLLQENYRDVGSKSKLNEILETIEGMGHIRRIYDATGDGCTIYWKED